jgi:hypothetical protein
VPARAVRRLAKWARRRPVLAGTFVLLFCAAAGIVADGVWYVQTTKELAGQDRLRAETARRFQYAAELSRASDAAAAGNLS